MSALDVLAAIFLVGGSGLAFAAGLGLLRFPDLLARAHAAAKPQVLGLTLVLIGLALRLRSGPAIWMLVLVALFQLITAPVAAHLVTRAGYRTGKADRRALIVDELTEDLEAADARRSDERRSDERRSGERRSDERPVGDPRGEHGSAPPAAR